MPARLRGPLRYGATRLLSGDQPSVGINARCTCPNVILFLAGIGTASGYAVVSTLGTGSALSIYLAGALVTLRAALLSLWIGYRLLNIPIRLLIGMVAGIQTQPAVVGFALKQTGNNLPNSGYTAVYPVALIATIILAQMSVALLSSAGAAAQTPLKTAHRRSPPCVQVGRPR